MCRNNRESISYNTIGEEFLTSRVYHYDYVLKNSIFMFDFGPLARPIRGLLNIARTLVLIELKPVVEP